MVLMRCYVCRKAVSFEGTLFLSGVEEDEVVLCEMCADLMFPGIASSHSCDCCVMCGVKRPSMN